MKQPITSVSFESLSTELNDSQANYFNLYQICVSYYKTENIAFIHLFFYYCNKMKPRHIEKKNKQKDVWFGLSLIPEQKKEFSSARWDLVPRIWYTEVLRNLFLMTAADI